jgi:glycosyltransferase involved in cell wall biosynthesis
MRTLVVAGEYPWPTTSGSRIRLLSVLRGLRRCGPTELFAVVPDVRTDFVPPDDDLDLAKVATLGVDGSYPRGVDLIAQALVPSMPLELNRTGADAAARALARFRSGPYDLVWYFGVRPWALMGGIDGARVVVDVVDLEDRKIEARRTVPRRRPAGVLGHGRRVLADGLSGEEARRWRRLQVRAGRAAARTVVCSALDAGRARESGVPRVEVVVNGYPRPEVPVGSPGVGDPPTVLFQGSLHYPPNAHGSQWLVNEVAPLLWAELPAARIRLVGRPDSAVSALHHPPAVTVVGTVDDITTELGAADLVVVPVHFGSGTRLKIVEAFAHRIPVVSTSIGAEGLDAVGGRHLLLADTPAAMAAACVRLLTDQALRRTLVDQAERLYLERYTDECVEEAVGAVARAACSA